MRAYKPFFAHQAFKATGIFLLESVSAIVTEVAGSAQEWRHPRLCGELVGL